MKFLFSSEMLILYALVLVFGGAEIFILHTMHEGWNSHTKLLYQAPSTWDSLNGRQITRYQDGRTE